MKGRYCIATFFLALLFASVSGYSQNTDNPSKSPTRHKRTTRSSRPAPPLNSDGAYVIRRGDSLYKIARVYKTTPEALMSANKLQSDRIKAGQELKIPAGHGSAAKGTPKIRQALASPDEPSISSGVSQPGDQNQAADAGTQPLRLRLVKAGFEWIGVRYRPSGGSAKSGFDCSGLVKSLFSKFNIDLPRSSREQFKQGKKIDRDKLEAGDLVFFSSGGDLPTHVGIYVGNNQFLHAALKARHVIVSDFGQFWHTMRYLGARRIMDLWWEEPGSAAEEN